MAGTRGEASAAASKEEAKGDAAKTDSEKKEEAASSTSKEETGKDSDTGKAGGDKKPAAESDGKEKPAEGTEKKEAPKRKGEVLKRPQDASTVVTRNGKTWNEMFDALVVYKARVGDTMVPDRFKNEDGVCLGLWVRNQRRRKESLTDEQQKRLSDLGLDWQTQNERFDNVWHDRYAKLTEYRVEHGDCRVPYTYKPDPALAKWVSQQRAQQAQGRLALDRKAKLDAIDFSWKLNTVKNRNTKTEDKKWQRQYEKLVEFNKEHDHCKVPDRYKADRPLGTWVKKQRLANACDQLKEDRKKMLDELGFVWRITDKTDGEKWDRMLEKLKEYKDTNGTCHVSRTVPDSELKPLARWVKTQRALYKSGKILPDRKLRLEEISFVWDGTQLPIKRKRRRQAEDGETKAEPKSKKAKAAATSKEGDDDSKPAAKKDAPKKAAVAKATAKKAPAKADIPEAKVVDKAVVEKASAPAKKGKKSESEDKADSDKKESPAKAAKSDEPETPSRRGKRTKMTVNKSTKEGEEEEKEEKTTPTRVGRSKRIKVTYI